VTTVWIVSMVLAWVVIVLLTVAVLSLLRQLGELRSMLAPSPRVIGAQLYDEVPLEGPVLLVFHEPGDEVERALRALAVEAPAARLVSVTPHAVEDLPAALRPATLPALAGISREGAVCAVGQASTLAGLREAAEATAGAVMLSGPGARRAMSWGVCVPYWESDRRRASSAATMASAVSPPTTSSGSSGSA
jgi:hypothetical protein